MQNPQQVMMGGPPQYGNNQFPGGGNFNQGAGRGMNQQQMFMHQNMGGNQMGGGYPRGGNQQMMY